MNFLQIDGVDISDKIKSMKPQLEFIWDENAGRTMTGDFVGDIINKKWKLNFTTKPISQEDSNMLMGLINKPSFRVRFIPTTQSTPIERVFYSNSPSHEVYSFNDDLAKIRYSSMAFNVIER